MARRPLDDDENVALDRLSEGLAEVLDRGRDPQTLVPLVRDALTAFGEDWRDDAGAED